MEFPVELIRKPKIKGLALYVSSLPLFSKRPVIIQDNEIKRLGFFNLTYEQSYTVQEIESEFQRQGIENANAYRVLKTKKINLEKPYREMKITTFRAYHIPETIAKKERGLTIDLAQSCTS